MSAQALGAGALPVILAGILLWGAAKKIPLFDTFLLGAKEGLRSTAALLPTLIGLILAVRMVRASGLPELLCDWAAPLARALGVSPELFPLAALRPISGSGASAWAMALMKEFGPDSETGKIASVMTASTETTFYAVAVYFGACGCKKTGYAVPAALIGDFTAALCSVLTVKLLP